MLNSVFARSDNLLNLGPDKALATVFEDFGYDFFSWDRTRNKNNSTFVPGNANPSVGDFFNFKLE